MSQSAGMLGVGLAVGLGAGLAAGFMLFGHAPAEPLGGQAGTDAAPRSATAPAPAIATAAAAGPTTAAAPPPATVPPAPGAPEGAITGRVTTVEGASVAGVRVRAHPHDPGVPETEDVADGPPPLEDLDTALRKAREAHARSTARIREAETDADGTYRIDGLAGPYWLEAWRTGFVIESRGNADARPGGRIDFVARPAFALAVDVRLPGGGPPDRATIECRRGGGRGASSETWVWSPAHTTRRLAIGAWKVRATAGGEPAGSAAWTSDEQTVGLPAEAPPPSLAFTLRSRRGIGGRVFAPDGDVADGYHVYASRLAPGATADPATLKSGAKNTSADAPGESWVIYDCEPGTWAVGATRDWNGPIEVTAMVEVRDGIASVDLTLPPPDPTARVAVRVRDHAGQPVEEVDFSVETQAENGHTSSGVSASAGDDGTWSVGLDDESRKALRAMRDGTAEKGASVWLEVSAGGHGTRRVRVPPDLAAPLDIQFGAPATLVVTVAGYLGRERSGPVRVGLEPAAPPGEAEEAGSRGHVMRMSSGAIDEESEPLLDAQGRRTMGPVEAGTYDVAIEIALEGRWVQWVPIAHQAVTLAPGENGVTLALPALYPLAIRVEGAAAGTNVNLVAEAGADDGTGLHLWMELPEGGRLVIPRLPAGGYRLHVNGGKKPGQMPIRIPEQSEVAFAPVAPNAIRVMVQEADGYLASTGLKTGDDIIGIEGARATSVQQMGMLFMAAMAKETVNLRIARGGTELDLPVDPKRMFRGLMDQEPLGGWLRPVVR